MTASTVPATLTTAYEHQGSFIDTARVICGRVYAAVRRPSVCLSVCPIYRPLKQHVAGLLLWAGRVGDIERLLHGLTDSTDSPGTAHRYF